MTQKQIELMDQFGITFRFITPLLILCVGFFVTRELGNFDRRFDSIDTKLTAFDDRFDRLSESYHSAEKRIDRLEIGKNVK